MKFLPHRKAENTMLVNIIHHPGNRDTQWVDHLDIIYKDLDSGQKYVETFEAPEMEVYFAKPEARDYNYNKTFIEREDTIMKSYPYKDLAHCIAKEAGPEYMQFLKDCRQNGNRQAINNIHKFRYVFGSDYEIENWYRIQWALHNATDRPPVITKQFLDIEVDSIMIEGFPRDGECPINAVTLVDELGMTSFTFLLRNPENPQIQKFEDNIDQFVEKLHVAFDETYGELEYRFFMYDDEVELIKDLFKLIHMMKRDFILIWNMAFDIPYIIARMRELGMDPVSVMTHKDFKIREMFYKKDKLNFMVQNKSDYFKVSSYTAYADQMLWYAGLRKGQGELRSFALNAVAKKEIGDEKLDYSEDANIKTLPYVDYEKFVMYNIKDVLLQLGIERKTGDVDNVYQRASSNATSYNKIFKQTVFLKNRAYIEFFKQGLIIGNNTNIDYSIPWGEKIESDDEDEDEKFDGALVADPTLNLATGINLFGAKSSYVFDNVVDMDFSSMYPNIIITFNIAPNCMIGKLIIDRDIMDIYADTEGKVEDLGKDFIDNMLVGNPANMATKWFGLPGLVELNDMLQERFGLNDRKRINIYDTDVDKYYVDVTVKIG